MYKQILLYIVKSEMKISQVIKNTAFFILHIKSMYA